MNICKSDCLHPLFHLKLIQQNLKVISLLLELSLENTTSSNSQPGELPKKSLQTEAKQDNRLVPKPQSAQPPYLRSTWYAPAQGNNKAEKPWAKTSSIHSFFSKLISSFVSYIWRIKLVILMLPRHQGRKTVLLAMQRINMFHFSSRCILYIRVAWLFIIP